MTPAEALDELLRSISQLETFMSGTDAGGRRALSVLRTAVEERDTLKAEVGRLKDRINSRKIYYPLPSGKYEVGPDGAMRFLYDQGEATASELVARCQKAEADLEKARPLLEVVEKAAPVDLDEDYQRMKASLRFSPSGLNLLRAALAYREKEKP